MTDLQIAKQAKMHNIQEICNKLGITDDNYEQYGKYKAKLSLNLLNSDKPNGKLILVTAITPTTAGEGKTTTTVGLADGLNKLNKNAVVALREPSLGPVFGIKGGAAGGGYAQVVPMEDINLHFTGDFHAITSANNLLAALIDNHIQQGNALNIDTKRIIWKRCLDMNDRQLRFVVDGLGGSTNGVPREDGFDITVASEIMAILCLSTSYKDLKERLARIIIGYSKSGQPIFAKDLKAQGAMAVLLKDALKPNLVQTLENTPAIVHGGPFANIAHGCNSIIATKLALKLGDYCITEAGFGADLGAEKFLDIKCPIAGLKPDCVVMVATIRALKLHGGVNKDSLKEENLTALKEGMPNLLKHLENITKVYSLPVVVAVNRFPTDTDEEVKLLIELCKQNGYNAVLADGFTYGGNGMTELAKEVVKAAEIKSTLTHPYTMDMGIEEKILALTQKVYGGKDVNILPPAKKAIDEIKKLGLDKLPICVAKTQYSLSDDKDAICRPTNFTITVKNVKLSNGAGFIVVLTGDIMTMPGLPKVPAAEHIDLTEDGEILGLS